MSQLTLALEPDQMRRLLDLAAAESRTPEDLGREALDRFLAARAVGGERATPGEDRHAALRAMIGLAKGGRSDSSVRHDWRPEDEGR
jgi:predicted transcriptional regulator